VAEMIVRERFSLELFRNRLRTSQSLMHKCDRDADVKGSGHEQIHGGHRSTDGLGLPRRGRPVAGEEHRRASRIVCRHGVCALGIPPIAAKP
jgi:hypothetical protein